MLNDTFSRIFKLPPASNSFKRASSSLFDRPKSNFSSLILPRSLTTDGIVCTTSPPSRVAFPFFLSKTLAASNWLCASFAMSIHCAWTPSEETLGERLASLCAKQREKVNLGFFLSRRGDVPRIDRGCSCP